MLHGIKRLGTESQDGKYEHQNDVSESVERVGSDKIHRNRNVRRRNLAYLRKRFEVWENRIQYSTEIRQEWLVLVGSHIEHGRSRVRCDVHANGQEHRRDWRCERAKKQRNGQEYGQLEHNRQECERKLPIERELAEVQNGTKRDAFENDDVKQDPEESEKFP